MSFLDNYEDVNTRIKRFRQEFPSGRLVATIEDMDLAAGWILIKAEAYREFEDHVPSAVDFAYGNVATLTANMRKLAQCPKLGPKQALITLVCLAPTWVRAVWRPCSTPWILV
jgi:hypothetical protein